MAEEAETKMYSGVCPDNHCNNLLYFIPNVLKSVECTKCGQHHEISSLLNVKQTDGTSAALDNFLKSILCNFSATKKGTELVKVGGLSNYHCKLVSPLLTYYGMDKTSGKAKLLSELGQPQIFDCSVLCNRAFLIEHKHLEIDGYGKDKSGSVKYLGETLRLIGEKHNSSLIPLHADGDGHCLVHAISRAVVGRELLWHCLRKNLRTHLEERNQDYQQLFCDFVDSNEWFDIITEADPEYKPLTNEPFGLRNIHVFGLANVLHRPILLLDSIEGMQSSGDYSGIFLPALLPPEQCTTNNTLNKPLAIAWSSSARNHYVPLVGIKGQPLPKIHQSLLPKAWGVASDRITYYIDFDDDGCCEIGGSRCLPENYIDRLVSAMDTVFFEKYQVCPQLVSDVNQFICKPSNAISMSLKEVTQYTRDSILSKKLHRCISCQAVKECEEDVSITLRKPGGKLYKMLEETESGLIPDTVYAFDGYGLFIYNREDDLLKPLNPKKHTCDLCKGVLRMVNADGTVNYINGDGTTTTSTSKKGCMCGYKHYWDGLEYDNLPQRIDVPLEWAGKKVDEVIFWFDKEDNLSLNSNAYELATALVQKHFPGEFGSEVLIRKVVEKILQETALKESKEKESVEEMQTDEQGMARIPPKTPTKIILTGPKKKALHKEELNKSEAERMIKARTSHHAAFSQKKKSASVKSNIKQGKQEVVNKTKVSPKQSSTKPQETKLNTEQPVSGNLADYKKIKLSFDGREVTVTLSCTATFDDLHHAICEEFGIVKERQQLRYGFPPRELNTPDDVKSMVPLSHGDRVMVKKLKIAEEDEKPATAVTEPTVVESSTTMSDNTAEKTEVVEASEDSIAAQAQVAKELLDLLQETLQKDQWQSLQHQPGMFVRGGRIFDFIIKTMGELKDDEHLSIKELPGKKFAYNAKEDRIELCLGKKHIGVQPLTDEMMTQAEKAASSKKSKPMLRPEEGMGSFSGAVKHKNASEGRSAFSGSGHTLGGTSTLHRNDQPQITKDSSGNNGGPVDVVTTEKMVVDGDTGTIVGSGENNEEQMVLDEDLRQSTGVEDVNVVHTIVNKELRNEVMDVACKETKDVEKMNNVLQETKSSQIEDKNATQEQIGTSFSSKVTQEMQHEDISTTIHRLCQDANVQTQDEICGDEVVISPNIGQTTPESDHHS